MRLVVNANSHVPCGAVVWVGVRGEWLGWTRNNVHVDRSVVAREVHQRDVEIDAELRVRVRVQNH